MTITIDWVSGKTFLLRQNVTTYVVAHGNAKSDLEGYSIKLSSADAQVSSETFPLQNVSSDNNNPGKYVGYAIVTGIQSSSPSATITATPLDPSGAAITAASKDLTAKFVTSLGTDAGKLQVPANFAHGPFDETTSGQYILAYMTADPAADGVQVLFTCEPYTYEACEFWTDEAVPQKIDASIQFSDDRSFYAVNTASGRAAVRMITKQDFLATNIIGQMQGMPDQPGTDVYLANQPSKSPTPLWLAPDYAGPRNNNNCAEIPEYGDYFPLTVPISDSGAHSRFIVINDSYVITTEAVSDTTVYPAWVDINSNKQNQFTYYAQAINSTNIVGASPTSAPLCAVGSHENLPDTSLTPREAPLQYVVPNPGRLITLQTITSVSLGNGLFLSTQDFPASDLTGLDETKPIIAVFRFYMNGYEEKGTDKNGRIFSSDRPADRITAPTVTIDAGTIKFSSPYVKLDYYNAEGWGRNIYTRDKKKVGFDYYITYDPYDATNPKWYSKWDPDTDYYKIDTGTW